MALHVELKSSTLSSATYYEDREALDIRFNSGRTYTYEGVPREIFEGLRDAQSPGSYWHQNIKDKY